MSVSIQPGNQGCVDMTQAAKLLNVGRNTLFKLLRERGHFYDDNLPAYRLVEDGYFKVEPRQRQGTYGIKHWYTVTLVTGKGLSWLNEIIASLNEQRIRKTPPSVCPRNSAVDPPGGSAGSTGAGTRTPAELGQAPGQRRL